MNRQIRNKLIVIFSVMAIISGIALHATAADKKEIPEYIGSQACLPCHADKYVSWKSSNHAQMVVPIINSSNLPLDIASAPANLQAELRKAVYMVANSFFLERDPATQHYKLLGVSFDKVAKAYRPSGVNLDWSTSCAGCHTTNMNTPNLTWGEAGIGCEACHGPGRNHALNKGDISKIVASKDADICGQCHGGNDVQTGGKLMSDGTKWTVGFRPGMKLSSLPVIQTRFHPIPISARTTCGISICGKLPATAKLSAGSLITVKLRPIAMAAILPRDSQPSCRAKKSTLPKRGVLTHCRVWPATTRITAITRVNWLWTPRRCALPVIPRMPRSKAKAPGVSRIQEACTRQSPASHAI